MAQYNEFMTQLVVSSEEEESPDIRFDDPDLQPPVTQHCQEVAETSRPTKIYIKNTLGLNMENGLKKGGGGSERFGCHN